MSFGIFGVSSAKASAKDNQAIHSVCGTELSPSPTRTGMPSTLTEVLSYQGSAPSATHTGRATLSALAVSSLVHAHMFTTG